MKIQDLIAMIPEDAENEALRAIESITTFPTDNSARVRCNLRKEFRFMIEVRGENIVLTAERRQPVICAPGGFIAALRRTIYAIDEAIAEGVYRQSKPEMTVIFDDRRAPPADMDIPVWDEKSGKWYDAEY